MLGRAAGVCVGAADDGRFAGVEDAGGGWYVNRRILLASRAGRGERVGWG